VYLETLKQINYESLSNKEVITIEMGFLETKRRAYTISVL